MVAGSGGHSDTVQILTRQEFIQVRSELHPELLREGGAALHVVVPDRDELSLGMVDGCASILLSMDVPSAQHSDSKWGCHRDTPRRPVTSRRQMCDTSYIILIIAEMLGWRVKPASTLHQTHTADSPHGIDDLPNRILS